MFQCLIDEEVFGSVEHLHDHLAKRHLGWLRYGCAYCDTFLSTLAKVQAHNAQRHPGMPNQYRDASDDQMHDLDQMVKRCLVEAPLVPERKRKLIQPTGQYWSRQDPVNSSSAPFNDYSQNPDVVAPVQEELETPPKPGRKKTQEYRKPKSVDQKTWDELSKYDRPFCLLCNQNIAQSSIRDHVRYVHLGGKHLRCSVCGYEATTSVTMGKHFRKVHPKQAVREFVDSSKEVVEDLKVKCFGQILFPRSLDVQTVLTGWEKKCDRLFCAECNKVVFFSTITSVVNHIMMVHLKRDSVFCTYCDYGNFGDLRVLSGHMKAKHPAERQPRFCDERMTFQADVLTLFELCFGREIENGNIFMVSAGEMGPEIDHTVEIDDEDDAGESEGHQGANIIQSHSAQASQNREYSPQIQEANAPLPPLAQDSNLTTRVCLICNENVKVVDEGMHIFTKHIRKDVFFCRHCQHKNTGSQYLMECHIKARHPSKELVYRDDSTKYGQLAEYWRTNCFGAETE